MASRQIETFRDQGSDLTVTRRNPTGMKQRRLRTRSAVERSVLNKDLGWINRQSFPDQKPDGSFMLPVRRRSTSSMPDPITATVISPSQGRSQVNSLPRAAGSSGFQLCRASLGSDSARTSLPSKVKRSALSSMRRSSSCQPSDRKTSCTTYGGRPLGDVAGVRSLTTRSRSSCPTVRLRKYGSAEIVKILAGPPCLGSAERRRIFRLSSLLSMTVPSRGAARTDRIMPVEVSERVPPFSNWAPFSFQRGGFHLNGVRATKRYDSAKTASSSKPKRPCSADRRCRTLLFLPFNEWETIWSL